MSSAKKESKTQETGENGSFSNGNSTAISSGIDHSRLNAISHVMATRRSIRCYRQGPIPKDLIDELLWCAVNAPSAHNRQPWRFTVLHDRLSKSRLAEAMGTQLRADRLRDGDSTAAVEADVARSFNRITSAPIVVLVAATTADMDVYTDPRRQQAEFLMAVQSTAMAMENFLLVAHAAGLAACLMCAPLFCPEAVKSTLSLPMDWQPQAMITVGYPASAGKSYSRRPLAEVVRHVGEK